MLGDEENGGKQAILARRPRAVSLAIVPDEISRGFRNPIGRLCGGLRRGLRLSGPPIKIRKGYAARRVRWVPARWFVVGVIFSRDCESLVTSRGRCLFSTFSKSM
jgi:hypothetical protein